MSRDKQIEEMAKDMCEYYYEGTCYQDKKPCDCKCDIFTDAQYLYAKGYRKASEVAREIIDDLESQILPSGKGLYDFPVITHEFIAELKKKYTEVAERREGVENSPVDCSTPNVTDQKGEGK